MQPYHSPTRQDPASIHGGGGGTYKGAGNVHYNENMNIINKNAASNNNN
jgi:hypothetical protein